MIKLNVIFNLLFYFICSWITLFFFNSLSIYIYCILIVLLVFIWGKFLCFYLYFFFMIKNTNLPYFFFYKFYVEYYLGFFLRLFLTYRFIYILHSSIHKKTKPTALGICPPLNIPPTYYPYPS